MLQRLLLLCLLPLALLATETENLGLSILPAAKPLQIDGSDADWDLSGGIFICGDVEDYRTDMAVWYHAMYDADNLYVLVNWLDPTPLNNPGSTAGDFGWNGDCLQMRIITAYEQRGLEHVTHHTAWRGVNGEGLIQVDSGRDFKGQKYRDLQTVGARQAFRVWDDAKGYTQEIAIPWKLLCEPGYTPAAGNKLVMTVEPNFTSAAGKRVSIKGLFRAGVTPDRVFTFRAYKCWGEATLEAKAPGAPRPLRLADNRELPVSMKDGRPVVDWSALDGEKEEAFGVVQIPLDLPEPAYVSLNIWNEQGQVVRQLLTANRLGKGRQFVAWDGLATWNHKVPGQPLPPGMYTWRAIAHSGLGLQLRGWAHNAGRSPYDSPGGNWGGDQGNPCAVTRAGDNVVLGWAGSEAGKAVVCTDLDGGVLWRHKRGGFGGARHLAYLDGVVYVNDQQTGNCVVYRLDAAKGTYVPWVGAPDANLDLKPLLQPFRPEGAKGSPSVTGMDAAGGKLYIAFAEGNRVLALDAGNGSQAAIAEVTAPGDLEVGPDGAVYVISGTDKVIRLAADLTGPKVVISGLSAAAGLAVDANGSLYVGLGDPANQVAVFNAAGKELRRIGKPGGRTLIGKWDPSGVRFLHAIAVDAKGQLWVPENDDKPRRVSVWNAAGGAFVRELFGPTDYGALGGAICPTDPLIMVGHGCEWQLDATTGKATCLAVFHRGAMGNAQFGRSPDGRVYAAVAGWRAQDTVSLYERLGPGQWKLRTTLSPIQVEVKKRKTLQGIRVWSDANDDQQEQDAEVISWEGDLAGWINGWYMPMTPTLTFYGGRYLLAPVGYTACGAPIYDPARSKELPAPDDIARRGGMGAQRDMGNADGTQVVYNGYYGANNSDFVCFDIPSGRELWRYPNTYVGVHGGHRAPPGAPGLIRAAYDIVGTAKLPPPIGDIYVIPTDKGEWHILTGDGFYLSHLFQQDPLSVRWPTTYTPGTPVDDTPPGMGGEDFGGSITLATDGNLYVQAGKTAFVNLLVTGLDTVHELGAGTVTLNDEQARRATLYRGEVLQRQSLPSKAALTKNTIVFSGDLKKDFPKAAVLPFGTQKRASGEARLAWDDENLYVGWQVNDDTPWVNGASDPIQMYANGDTVDLQLGPDTGKPRGGVMVGDLRLSIGNLQGKPVIVIYRPKDPDKQPRTFYSGVVRDGYVVDRVEIFDKYPVLVKVSQGRYVIETALPLSLVGLQPKAGLAFRGDAGATFGDEATGTDTAIRAYWSNQATGLVNDEVFELRLEPKNWGAFSLAD